MATAARASARATTNGPPPSARSADVNALILTVQTLQTTVDALETENQRLRDCVETLEQAQRADREHIGDLHAQVGRLTAENCRLHARIADLERENTDLRAKLARPPSRRRSAPTPRLPLRAGPPPTTSLQLST